MTAAPSQKLVGRVCCVRTSLGRSTAPTSACVNSPRRQRLHRQAQRHEPRVALCAEGEAGPAEIECSRHSTCGNAAQMAHHAIGSERRTRGVAVSRGLCPPEIEVRRIRVECDADECAGRLRITQPVRIIDGFRRRSQNQQLLQQTGLQLAGRDAHAIERNGHCVDRPLITGPADRGRARGRRTMPDPPTGQSERQSPRRRCR